MYFCQIQHNSMCSEYLCKLGKEYLNTLKCKFYVFLDKKNMKVDISRAFFLINCHEFVNFQKQSDFLAHTVDIQFWRCILVRCNI